MRKNRFLAAMLTVLLLVGACCGASAMPRLNPKAPVTVVVWHYYNGVQQQMFDRMVLQFNETVGAERGIVVEAHSKGTIGDLTSGVLSALKQEAGASEPPHVFSAYADTAWQVNQMGFVAELKDYLTEEEWGEYFSSYLKEGQFDEEGSVKLFPIAKATELFLLNETAWDAFAAATGADKAKLSTWEGVAETAKAYFEWTDAKTPDVDGDGQAFFGRDAFANYMLIGSLQLGCEMFQVTDGQLTLGLDKDVLRRLWDNYYVPFVSGWYGAYGRFRSDDIKTGQIIALVGSTSGALYFPSEVTHDDGTTDAIACGAYALPNFEGTEPTAVQQGAGMVVLKSDEAHEYAATTFLKWFTQPEQNIEFAVSSGYLPVMHRASDWSVLENATNEKGLAENSVVRESLRVGVKITNGYRLYTNAAFEKGAQARQVVENSMMDCAKAALEKRQQLQQEGQSYQAALEAVISDEAFEAWYQEFSQALGAAVQP